MKEEEKQLFIIGGYKKNQIKLVPEEIMYIQKAKHGSKIILSPYAEKYDWMEQMVSKRKLDELYSELKKYGFLYPHDSYIVNTMYIKGFTVSELCLTDGTKMSVSRAKSEIFRNEITDMWSKSQNTF